MMTRRTPGVEPLGDAVFLFFAAVNAKLRTGTSRPDAIRELVAEQPALHAGYVKEHNVRVGPSTFRGQRA